MIKLTKKQQAVIDGLVPRCEDCDHYKDYKGRLMCHQLSPFLATKETQRLRPAAGMSMNCGTAGRWFTPAAKKKTTSRFIITADAAIGAAQAMYYCMEVAKGGRISGPTGREQHCYASEFSSGVTVYVRRNKSGSEQFTVRAPTEVPMSKRRLTPPRVRPSK